MGIATYNNKEQFKETNKWLFPKVMDYIKSLDGVVESIPGEILASWRKSAMHKISSAYFSCEYFFKFSQIEIF